MAMCCAVHCAASRCSSFKPDKMDEVDGFMLLGYTPNFFNAKTQRRKEWILEFEI